jgi:hypothetical protein
MKNILFASSGLKIFLQWMESQGYQVRNINNINLDRYFIVTLKKGTEFKTIGVTFKKDWFQTFGERGFINEQGLKETGIGDTLNIEDLKQFCSAGVKDIYIVYKQGSFYYIEFLDFINKSHKWKNKEGKEVRSISIHNYKRVN